jgi:hypothetical protein
LSVYGRDTGALIDAIAQALSAFEPEFVTIFTGESVDEETSNEVNERLSAAIPRPKPPSFTAASRCTISLFPPNSDNKPGFF